jgi:hypothetical protein
MIKKYFNDGKFNNALNGYFKLFTFGAILILLLSMFLKIDHTISIASQFLVYFILNMISLPLNWINYRFTFQSIRKNNLNSVSLVILIFVIVFILGYLYINKENQTELMYRYNLSDYDYYERENTLFNFKKLKLFFMIFSVFTAVWFMFYYFSTYLFQLLIWIENNIKWDYFKISKRNDNPMLVTYITTLVYLVIAGGLLFRFLMLLI